MTTSQSQALGEAIRDARRAAGLNQRQLAELVGINQSSLVRLEQGKTSIPRPRLLQAFSETLNLRLTDLYDLVGIQMPSLQPYLRAKYGLSPEATAQAAAYIERLAERDAIPTGTQAAGATNPAPVTNRRRSTRRQKGGNPPQ